MVERPGGMPFRWRMLPNVFGNADVSFFAFPTRGGDAMYLTIEQLFLIAGFILALLTYIDHKKK